MKHTCLLEKVRLKVHKEGCLFAKETIMIFIVAPCSSVWTNIHSQYLAVQQTQMELFSIMLK